MAAFCNFCTTCNYPKDPFNKLLIILFNKIDCNEITGKFVKKLEKEAINIIINWLTVMNGF